MTSPNSLPQKSYVDKDQYDGLQNFIETFRNQESYVSPEEWLLYIDLMAASRKSENFFGFTVQEFLPQAGNKEISMLRVVRRPDADCKVGKYCALLILRKNHRDYSRLAIVKSSHGDYYIKRAMVHHELVRLAEVPENDNMVMDFQRRLQNHRPADEIAHPSSSY